MIVTAALVAGCGSPPTPPDASVQSYMQDIAEGNFVSACGLLAPSARRALGHVVALRRSCPAIFRHCLPSNAIVTRHDQLQLLYANLDTVRSGRNAVATVSGTATARAIRHVTLVRQHGRWELTSYGQAFITCRRRGRPNRS